MILLTRGAPVLLEIGLLVFCLVDCLQSDARAVRTLGKGWWVLLIVVLPIVGGIAWLVAGRPNGATTPSPSGARRPGPPGSRPPARPGPLGPDDDPQFLQQLSQAARERALREREADLRRREEELKAGTAGPDAEGSPGGQDDPPSDGPGAR